MQKMIKKQRPEIKTAWTEVTTLKEALVFFRGNKSEMARWLGIERTTINQKIKRGDDRETLLLVNRKDGKIISLKLINHVYKRHGE